MVANLFHWYAGWVRNNTENAATLERFTQLAARVVTDPQNLMSTELAWSLIKLHALSNRMIIATTGRRVGFSERVFLIIQAVREIECLLELALRRYCGNAAAWDVLMILQAVKSLLGLLVHRQIFLAPWMWAAVRQRVHVVRRGVVSLTGYGKQISSAVAEGLSTSLRGKAKAVTSPLHNNNNNNKWVSGSTVGPANTRLVIPRVAARRVYRRASSTDSASVTSVVKTSESSLSCTAIDVLGLLVDLVLLLRPLLMLYFSKRAFPHGATGIATLPLPPTEAKVLATSKGDGNVSGTTEDHDGLFLVREVMKDGVSKSLLSNWDVWLGFFGLDIVLTLISRYIKRHRVPVVYIDNTNSSNSNSSLRPEFDAETNDGEVPSRSDNGSSNHNVHENTDNNNNNNSNSSNNNNNNNNNTNGSGISAPFPPPLPQPPINDVVEYAPAFSRDSVREQQVLRNMAFSFLRDPVFPALLQKFFYDHFIAGRINRIPLLGPILRFQVAYFLCKQHYCFMYLLEN